VEHIRGTRRSATAAPCWPRAPWPSRTRSVTTLTATRLADVAVGRPSGALKHESD